MVISNFGVIISCGYLYVIYAAITGVFATAGRWSGKFKISKPNVQPELLPDVFVVHPM